MGLLFPSWRPTAPHTKRALLILARILVDSINVGELDRRLPAGPDGQRSNPKLSPWLEQEGYPETDRDITTRRGLQDLRSRASAHRRGSDYPKPLESQFGAARGREALRQMLVRRATWLDDTSAWSSSRSASANFDNEEGALCGGQLRPLV
jgi:hypothetical protein